MSTDSNAKSIGITAIKTEIAKLNPVDPKAVDDMVAHRLRIDALGVPYIVDVAGVREDTISLEQFLGSVRRDHPHLFQGSPSHSTGGSSNPFIKGPGYSVTRQMALLKTNPTEARRQARLAGVDL